MSAHLKDSADAGVFLDGKPRKRDGWRKVSKFAEADGVVVDVWLTIYASPLSMGFSDSFGVPDAWRDGGKWMHTYRGAPAQLDERYVSHWRPRP